MKLYAQTNLLCHGATLPDGRVTPVGFEIVAGAELPSAELLAELKAAHDATGRLLAKAVREDERKALDAKLDELSAQIKHVQYALEFLASPVGVSSVKKWSERGRLSQARPAPKQAADAAKLLDAERAARKLDAQSRVEKYQKRHDEAEKSGNKTKAATYAELLDEAKADLVSLGV